AARRTRAVLKAQDPWRASSWTWTAASGPMDSALRTVARADAGPMHRTTTSPPCCSLSRRASSTAYSSTGLGIVSTDSRARVGVEGFVRRLEPLLGGRVGHALDGDQDLQRCLQGWPVAGPCPGRRP